MFQIVPQADVLRTIKKITPKAQFCSKREIAILATALKDMELRGLSRDDGHTIIQVAACMQLSLIFLF